MMIRFINGLQKKIEENNSDFDIMVHPYTTGKLNKEKAYFSGSYFHTAIVANTSQQDLRFLNKLQVTIPTVLYNRLSDHYSSVNVDDKKIGTLIVNHLLAQGYKSPLLLYCENDFPGATIRKKSILENFSLARIEISENHIDTVINSVEGGIEYGEKLATNNTFLETLDVVICPSDMIAFGLEHSLLAHHIRIPEDIAILAIGNGSPEYSRYSSPPITVVNIPMEEMAETCYEMILK
ncbi:MAG: substrate-binding domain-containing protein [Sphaerochaeta sp.]